MLTLKVIITGIVPVVTVLVILPVNVVMAPVIIMKTVKAVLLIVVNAAIARMVI